MKDKFELKFAIDIQNGKYKSNFKIETQIEFEREFRNQILNIKIEIEVWNVNYKENKYMIYRLKDNENSSVFCRLSMCKHLNSQH